MIRCFCCELEDPTKRAPKNAQSTYTVSYNSESHFSVLTQMWGSTWLKVLPFCAVNVALMVVLIALRNRFDRDALRVSKQGHTFLTLVISFLLVSRVSMSLSRYMAARESLGNMYRQSRDLIQNVCAFTMHLSGRSVQEWRYTVTYRTLILLRTAMAVVDFPTTRIPTWELAELSGEERQDVLDAINVTRKERKYASGILSDAEESMRVPIRLAYLLRKAVVMQRKVLGKDEISASHELRLLGHVDGFMTGFYGIRKFLTTPTPFPLIQMARWFLFLYVFTVPFVLLNDDDGDFAHCFEVFLITYGFFGLEAVSMELDNPFGDDANDFSSYGMACTAYEDTFKVLEDIDGQTWSDKLRKRMEAKPHQAALSPTEESMLLDHAV